MNPFAQIFIGSIIGMALLIAVRSEMIRRGSKYDLNFWQAFRVYTTKHTGPMIVGALVIFGAMFVFPNILAHYTTEAPEGSVIINTRIKSIIEFLRFYSIGLGVAAQGIGFLTVGASDKYLKQEEEKLKNKPNAE